jgi:hypothetical protein
MTRAADLAKLIAGGGSITVSDNSENLKLVTTDADASVGPTLRMDRQSSSAADSDLLGKINFVGHNDAGTPEDIAYAGITAIISDASDGTEDGKLAINTIVAGTERSRIFVDAGETVINEDSIDVDFRVESDGNANMFIVDGGQNKVGIGVSPAKGMLHIQPSARTTNFDASDHTSYADIYVHNPTDDDTCATGIAFATDASSFDNGASGIACFSGTGDSESGLAFITRPNGAVSAERMRITSSGNVGIGTTSPSARLDITSTDSDAVFLRSSQTNNTNVYITNTNATTDNTANLIFAPANNVSGSQISCIAKEDFSSSANRTADLAFSTRKDGTMSERMRIASDGNVAIGNNNPADDTPAIGFQFDVTSSNTSFMNIGHTSSAGTSDAFIRFIRSNTKIGEIATNGVTNVQYSTSSDYRLKENIVTEWDATSRLKQLKPSRFNFKEEKDITRDGFIAHEVSSVVPEAVSGEKDAVDKNGNIDPQGIDHSKLVPLMVKTIQELEARIATLESK